MTLGVLCWFLMLWIVLFLLISKHLCDMWYMKCIHRDLTLWNTLISTLICFIVNASSDIRMIVKLDSLWHEGCEFELWNQLVMFLSGWMLFFFYVSSQIFTPTLCWVFQVKVLFLSSKKFNIFPSQRMGNINHFLEY